jgi:hypothetical protein
MSLDTLARFGAILTSFVTMLAFAVALVFAYVYKDTQNLSLIIGAIIANATTVVSYWLGSSSGSARKTEILSGAIPQVPVIETVIPTTAARPPGSL